MTAAPLEQRKKNGGQLGHCGRTEQKKTRWRPTRARHSKKDSRFAQPAEPSKSPPAHKNHTQKTAASTKQGKTRCETLSSPARRSKGKPSWWTGPVGTCRARVDRRLRGSFGCRFTAIQRPNNPSAATTVTRQGFRVKSTLYSLAQKGVYTRQRLGNLVARRSALL